MKLNLNVSTPPLFLFDMLREHVVRYCPLLLVLLIIIRERMVLVACTIGAELLHELAFNECEVLRDLEKMYYNVLKLDL